MPFCMTNGSPCVAQLEFDKLVIWDGNHTGLGWKHLKGHNPIQPTKSRFISTSPFGRQHVLSKPGSVASIFPLPPIHQVQSGAAFHLPEVGQI